jgi:excisionase family DNA binding protein
MFKVSDRLPDREFFTVEETATYLNVAVRTVRSYIAERRCDFVKILGGAVRIPRAEIVRILDAGYQSRIIHLDD